MNLSLENVQPHFLVQYLDKKKVAVQLPPNNR